MPGGDPRNLVSLKGGAATGAAPGEIVGEVWLVGAGPGDPELLTVKAMRLLQSADVVVHDRLTPEALLDLARPDARRIDVGKRKSRHTLPQDDINQLLVALAREGLKVVRLKGGDPFVFGRGGEELQALRDAGVQAHVVPGVTAALAAAAGAGVPLTHRGLAQAVTFVTGHAASKNENGNGEPGEPDLDWLALSRPNHTVVVYMGVTTAGPLAARLIQAGRAPSTPVLVVENASRADERRVLTRLDGLSKATAGLDGPALLVIGEVAALADLGLADVEPLIASGQSCRAETRMKVLTANSLETGEALFWNKGQWKVRFADGEHFAADDEAAPSLAAAEGQPTVVVAPYLIDVEEEGGHWFPIAFRERLRALGPSNHPHHGKQADGDADVAALQAVTSSARSAGRVKLIKR